MATYYESISPSTKKAFVFQNNDNEVFSITAGGALRPAASLQDTNAVSRLVFKATPKTIVDGSPTSLFTVPIAQGSAIGGSLDFSVFATDGTDHQTISGIATFASVNKAGTLTSTITYVAANEAKAVSSGTLTLAFTMAEDTADVVTVKVQPTGSLTETTYNIIFTVTPLRGEVTLV